MKDSKPDPRWKSIIDRQSPQSVAEFKRWCRDAEGWLREVVIANPKGAIVIGTAVVGVAAIHAAGVGAAELAEQLKLNLESMPLVSAMDALGRLAKYIAWCDNRNAPDGQVAHDTYRVDGRDVWGLAENEIALLKFVHERADNGPNEADILVAVWGDDESKLKTRKDIDSLYPRVNVKLKAAECKRSLRWSSKRMVLRIPKLKATVPSPVPATRKRRGKRVGKK